MKPKPKEKSQKATDQPKPHHWDEMNRKQRREMTRKIQSEDLSLEVIHPDAAGIDIGNESHYASVPPSRDSQPVREFGCTTAELRAMAAWLKQCRIRTIAMQSTGVYWVAVYDILEQAGLEVYLVNARDTKNLPGRKSDVQESQWLMKLHTYGLLRNSFRPSQEIRMMRTCWRQRNDLVQSAGRHIQRMQKALTQMNLQLANVLSDISGATGQAIIKAILAGERDPHKLAQFRDPRVKASEEQIAQSLEGNWQEDLLFVLKQEQNGYEFRQKQMVECDRQLAQYLQQREDRSHGAPLPEEKRKERLKKKKGNKPQFDLRKGLFRMTGTDLTCIDGIDVMTAATVISEAGYDMSKWKTEDHFVSWLRLCPDNRISGNKVIGKGRLPTNNPISIALKMAASTLRTSKTYLGAQFRRLRTKLGAPCAIKAMAAKLARLVYRMLRYGMKYVDQGAAFYELRHRELQIKRLKAKAEKLGYRVTPIPVAA
ncbi:MAG TPA: IS110 family transposase [Candidatus Acidoferrales bacterium]|jgi:transposase|nr:IS110 family transposase [Candidatus Acidoferrales bacterium]